MWKLHNSYGSLDYLTHLLPKVTLSAAVCNVYVEKKNSNIMSIAKFATYRLRCSLAPHRN